MAKLTASLGNAEGAREQYSKYIDLLWHDQIMGNRTKDMLESYEKIKDLRPELYSVNGQAVVRGLDI